MFGKIQREFFITKCWNQNKLLLYNDDLSNWLIWRGIRRENTIPLARNTTSKISNCLSTFSYTLNIGCFKYWFHYRWLESHSYSLLLPSNKDLQLSFVKKKRILNFDVLCWFNQTWTRLINKIFAFEVPILLENE